MCVCVCFCMCVFDSLVQFVDIFRCKLCIYICIQYVYIYIYVDEYTIDIRMYIFISMFI